MKNPQLIVCTVYTGLHLSAQGEIFRTVKFSHNSETASVSENTFLQKFITQPVNV